MNYRLYDVLYLYLEVLGIAPIEFLKKASQIEGLKWNEKELKKAMKDAHCSFYKEYIYSDEIDTEYLDNILEERQGKYMFFSLKDLIKSYNENIDAAKFLMPIIHVDYEAALLLVMNFFVTNNKDVKYFPMLLRRDYSLTKKKEEKVFEYFGKIDFRTWENCGKTKKDMEREEMMNLMTMKTEPEEKSLEDILNHLSKNVYKTISFTVAGCELPKEELASEILKNFTKTLQEYSEEQIFTLLDLNHQVFLDNEFLDDLMVGYVYLYEEDGFVKCLLPSEIETLLIEKCSEFKELNLEERDKKMWVLSHLVMQYVYYNGLIEDKMLQKLLKENHDIELSIEEIDEISKQLENEKLDHYYFFTPPPRTINEVKVLIGLKERFQEYKKVNLEDEDKYYAMEEDFLMSLRKCNVKENSILPEIHMLFHLGILNEKYLKKLMKDNEVKLSNSQIKEILALASKYERDIPIWSMNGFNQKERSLDFFLKQEEPKKKVGRNEPCPCGSGRKYKQCCGR